MYNKLENKIKEKPVNENRDHGNIDNGISTYEHLKKKI